MKAANKRSRGFGLIEILVTLGVLTVGILGVATLHGVITRQTQDNKARIEAIGIAESRIEEMRNYTSIAGDLTDFGLLYPETAGFANSATINGINAVFTRTENIADLTSGKEVTVRVAWTSAQGEAESVSLGTELVFVSPRSIADAAFNAAPEFVDAPTGRARLGEGQLPDDAVTTSNGDGTSLYQDGGTDLMLVSEDQIVLTLAMACQTEDGTCIDFVKIKGRVWIDTATQNIDPGEVFVLASDAAFCARYYTVGATTYQVTKDTASTVTTPGGDYEYFDYTCYIGGGWHGNVGVLLAGGLTQQDKVCMGDPISLYAWERPVLAARRSYRGMLYKHDDGELDLRQKIAGTNLVRYYSQGLADQTLLPAAGEAGHDFVINSMPSSETSDAACVGRNVMVRADSNVNGFAGDLFEGMPTDFVCLNNGLLDDYDADEFGHDITCPYDPTDPPIERHSVTGALRVSGANTLNNDNIVAAIGLVTSDGPGNCNIGAFSYQGSFYTANYVCSVFDWGSGWNGNIELVYVSMACTTDTLALTNVTGVSSNNNLYGCTITETPPDPETDSYILFSGVVDSPNNRELSSVTMSDGGACALAADGLSYTCSTLAFTGTWSGSLTFSGDSNICTATATGSSPAQMSFSNLSAGNVTLNIVMKNNASQCP